MFCKQCGTKLDPDARFCPGCGASLTPSEEIPAQGAAQVPTQTPVIPEAPITEQPPKKKKKKKHIFLFLLLALLGILMLPSLVSGGGDGGSGGTAGDDPILGHWEIMAYSSDDADFKVVSSNDLYVEFNSDQTGVLHAGDNNDTFTWSVYSNSDSNDEYNDGKHYMATMDENKLRMAIILSEINGKDTVVVGYLNTDLKFLCQR